MFTACPAGDNQALKTKGDEQRDRAAKRSRKLAAAASEIGAYPELDVELWERYRLNLFAYLQECFPQSTGLSPLSLDHKRIAERTQQAILHGGQDLFKVFRGFAKSTIIENAATWAAGYGHRKFFVPLASTDAMALIALDSIQFEFETNDHLMQIFPQVCHAARALEGVPQRAGKQSINGELTHIEWSSKRCVLPTVKGFAGSGAIIWPKGITANSIRGLRFKRADGEQARPDFIMGDDLQTDASAASPAQNNKRLNILTKTVMRLAGHKTKMALVINATAIEPDDLIEQLSDRKKFPGIRTLDVPMLKSYAKHQDDEWLGKYAEIRSAYSEDDEDDRIRAEEEANAYYKKHRKKMDSGAEATWFTCYDVEHELSAIQHAYNIWIDSNEDSFMAECQGKPVRERTSLEILTPDQICRKQSDFPRGQFAKEVSTLVAMIDCHEQIFYSEVWAFEPSTTGYRIDDPTFPDQRRKYFAHRSISRKLKKLFPGLDPEATVIAGLNAFLHGYEGADPRDNWPGLMRMVWKSESGVPHRIRCCLVDANGTYRDAIIKTLTRSPFAANLHPSFGIGISAKKAALSSWAQYRKQKNVGPEWCFTDPKPGEVAGIMFDSNYYKGKLHRGLVTPKGSRGALMLHKCNPVDHRMTADHYTAEQPREVTNGSRTVTEFNLEASKDNHRGDCAAGAQVAASRCGISNLSNPRSTKPRKRKRKTTYD